MYLINLKNLINIFKKNFKKFLYLNLVFVSFFILANLTLFNEKLDKVYDVTFDYKYQYNWAEASQQSLEFDLIVSNLKYQGRYREVDAIAFTDLKSLHSSYFSLLYQYNIEDIKSNDFNNKNRKIAQSFNFDTANFTFKNKKIHIAWDSLKEAEDYLYSLHTRSLQNIKNSLEFSLKENKIYLINQLKTLIKIYRLDELKVAYLNSKSMKNGIDGIDGVKTNKFIEDNIKKSNFHKMTIFEMISFITSPSLNFVDAQLLHEKKNLLVYYFVKKINPKEFGSLESIDLLPEYRKLIDSIEKYLPKYNKKIEKIDYILVYFVEILLSIIISTLIIFAPNKIRRKKH